MSKAVSVFALFAALAMFLSGTARASPTWSQKLQCDKTDCPRFELVMDGVAVLDKETGLVWAKNANLASGDHVGGLKAWAEAVTYCHNLNIGNRKGWRLPTVEELASLIDPTQTAPALPSGHPFVDVQLDYYWSSTTYERSWYIGSNAQAWGVDMQDGSVTNLSKSFSAHYIWPVRGGSGLTLVPHTTTP